MTPDPVLARIHTIQTQHAGDRDTVRRLFAEVWDDIGAGGDALHRCTLAHLMADVQDDPATELTWDLRALDAAAGITDEHTAQAGMVGGAAALYPSLHLNLADVYRRLGDHDAARVHVAQGLDHVGVLGDDGYGRMVRGGLERVADAVGPS